MWRDMFIISDESVKWRNQTSSFGVEEFVFKFGWLNNDYEDKSQVPNLPQSDFFIKWIQINYNSNKFKL